MIITFRGEDIEIITDSDDNWALPHTEENTKAFEYILRVHFQDEVLQAIDDEYEMQREEFELGQVI